MNAFPLTSMTLIRQLAAEDAEGNEAAWVRFFNLYTPAIRRFVRRHAPAQDADDVVQEVYMKIVDVLRAGKYRPDKARFHSFLVLLIRRQLIALYRRESARGGELNVAMDDLEVEPAIPADQAIRIDGEWSRAKHEAAVEHVLTQMPISIQTRNLYRAYVLEERPVNEVVTTFGVTKDILYKAKNRVDRMIAAVEAEYDEEC